MNSDLLSQTDPRALNLLAGFQHLFDQVEQIPDPIMRHQPRTQQGNEFNLQHSSPSVPYPSVSEDQLPTPTSQGGRIIEIQTLRGHIIIEDTILRRRIYKCGVCATQFTQHRQLGQHVQMIHRRPRIEEQNISNSPTRQQNSPDQ